jgi:SAM-dependent methyltransferase
MSTSRFGRSAEEVAGLKAAQQAAWNSPGSGYHDLAEGFVPAVEHLLEFAGIVPGMTLLDVATGTGIAALFAARRGAIVTGVDFAEELLDHARKLADEAGLPVLFVNGDAEAMPFEDSSFDAVISTFGCMFAPRHDAVARELVRVLKPGGTLALACWKPEGPNHRLMTITAPYLPARVQELPSPTDWGIPEYVQSLLEPACTGIRFADGDAPWLADSPETALEMLFERSLGPTVYTYRRFSEEIRARVREDAMALMQENLASDGSVRLSRDYLLTVATKRTG